MERVTKARGEQVTKRVSDNERRGRVKYKVSGRDRGGRRQGRGHLGRNMGLRIGVECTE